MLHPHWFDRSAALIIVSILYLISVAVVKSRKIAVLLGVATGGGIVLHSLSADIVAILPIYVSRPLLGDLSFSHPYEKNTKTGYCHPAAFVLRGCLCCLSKNGFNKTSAQIVFQHCGVAQSQDWIGMIAGNDPR